MISSAPSNLQSGDNWDLWENLSQPINAPRDTPSLQSPKSHPATPMAAPQSMNEQGIQLPLCSGGWRTDLKGVSAPLQRVRCLRGKGVCCSPHPRPRQLGSTSGKSRTSPIYKDLLPAPSSSRMVTALVPPHCPPRPPTCAPLAHWLSPKILP